MFFALVKLAVAGAMTIGLVTALERVLGVDLPAFAFTALMGVFLIIAALAPDGRRANKKVQSVEKARPS